MPALSFATYRRTLQSAPIRRLFLLGLLLRAPMFAGMTLLPIHGLLALDLSYAQAGLLVTAFAAATAVASPWRGRLLDRYGLRKTLAPAVLGSAICWSIIPFVGFELLLPLALVAGAFVLRANALIRQALVAAVPESDRRSVFSLDGISVELSAIVAPGLAVWAGAHWNTGWVLLIVEWIFVLGGVVAIVANPPLVHPADDLGSTVHGQRWVKRDFVLALVATATVTTVLSGTDLALVAGIRELGQVGQLGIVIALWGAGSIVGGLAYGAHHRSISPYLLLGALGAATVPLVLATGVLSLGLLAFVAGVACAPAISATIEVATQLAPAAHRGEAMGWHQAALNAGAALGPVAVGSLIDRHGHEWGFAAMGLLALLVAFVSLASRRQAQMPVAQR